MHLFVHATINAKEERFERTNETHFRIAVKEPPKEGRANAAIASLLAKNLNIPLSRIRLLRGARGREKVFII